MWTAPGVETLRSEFEQRFGKNKDTGAGEWLDLARLVPGERTGPYRSMVTEYAWRGFIAGRVPPQRLLDQVRERLGAWIHQRMSAYTDQQYGKGAMRALWEELNG